MERKILLIVLGFVALQFVGLIHGAIPAPERAALIALYNSTNGDSWTDKSGWKTPPLDADGFAMPGTEGSWKGVSVYRNESVYRLSLYDNQLSGSIPSELGSLSNLEFLELGNNQLSGSIPSELGSLSNLKDLWLINNQLSGSIPSSLGSLSNLLYLFLDSNQLSGSIPSSLGSLSNLWGLTLEDNQLSGSIPSSLGSLSNLETLSLKDNQLSGSIPSSLGSLSNLQVLYLDSNQLSGSIPTTLTNLTNISELDIGYNCLTATDLTLRAWLNTNDPDWEAHQDQCRSSTTPTITTNSVSSITSTSAVSGGDVTSDAGATVTARGVCWNTTANPTISHSKTTNGTGTGSFTSSITGLSANTLYFVRAYATNSKGTAYGANQTFTTLGFGTPVIGLSHTTLNFGAIASEIPTNAQIVLISNTGSGTLNWSAASNASWLSVNPTSGTGDASISISANPAGLPIGTYTGTITITDPNASNSPQSISVELQVYNQGSTTVPFGEFATPVEGAATYSSVPVTGWALDDVGVASIKIYNGDQYVGDAVFVEGARPDVQTAYPNYPNNYKAGWGYMLLTHFLPGGGNGTYTLVAKAVDMEGNEVVLGSKTITIDNAHAVKPFGAIDTPTQGGTASGSAFRNNGWALTPMPNKIPTNGSTINVYINGGLLGHATYNLPRADIAQLFPGYANSNNAWGYYDIDTTQYTNGIHTIQWTAADNVGNTDGIGSRYFTIQNTSSDNAQSASTQSIKMTAQQISTLPEYASEPIYFNTGFHGDNECSELQPDEKGNHSLSIKELERVEIQLGQNYTDIQGFLISGQILNPLPIGSTLDVKTGTFSWSPGPGFVGNYSLVFVLTDVNRQSFKKSIEIKIEPKFSN